MRRGRGKTRVVINDFLPISLSLEKRSPETSFGRVRGRRMRSIMNNLSLGVLSYLVIGKGERVVSSILQRDTIHAAVLVFFFVY